MRARAKPKTAYHHGDLRSALLAEAVRAGRVVGLEALTLKQLSQGLGVSHTAPYRHFADKRALVHALAESGFAELATALARAHGKAPRDSVEQFLEVGFAVVRFASTHPVHYSAMFFGHKPSTLDALRAAPEASAFGLVLEYIRGWQAAGLFDSDEPLALALAIWSTTHGLACLLSSGQLGKKSLREVRALSDAIHRRLFAGLSPR